MAVVTVRAILAMQRFDIVFVLTNPPGGPSNSTLTPVLHLYNEGFKSSRHGCASAVAWVLFILIFGLTVVRPPAAGGVEMSVVHRGQRAMAVKIATYVGLTLVAVVVLFPFLVGLSIAFKEPRDVVTYPPTLAPRSAATGSIEGVDGPVPLYELADRDGTYGREARTRCLNQLRHLGSWWAG